jgi:hypothetical protein
MQLSCSKPGGGEPQPTDARGDTDSARQSIDACALLSATEIEKIQGAPPRQMTPSTRSGGGVSISQCYFALPAAPDSLSLAVTQPVDAAQVTAVKSAWEEMFHREKPKRTGRDGKEKKQPTATAIRGIGDEAFWTGGQFGGTLHVLKGGKSFTLSIGGPGDEAALVQKLKDLGATIASRM